LRHPQTGFEKSLASRRLERRTAGRASAGGRTVYFRPRVERHPPVAGTPGVPLERLQQPAPPRLAGGVVGCSGRHLAPEAVEQLERPRPILRGFLGVCVEGQQGERLARDYRVETAEADSGKNPQLELVRAR
jgi:hypothetical protein